MKAIITGASSGMGRDFARELSRMGYTVVISARRLDRLQELKNELNTPCEIFCTDLAKTENVHALFAAHPDADILINDAGFGCFGKFEETDKDEEMLDVNIRALHMLTKLYLKEFKKKNAGYIMNVASSAAFMPGPLLAQYYASKAYVLRLTQAIVEELRHEKSKVHVCALCPGPVSTEFNKVADVKFSVKPLTSEYVTKYALNKMFKGKKVIVPGLLFKLARVGAKITPDSVLARISYHIQKRR